jgi:hypothetical protein
MTIAIPIHNCRFGKDCRIFFAKTVSDFAESIIKFLARRPLGIFQLLGWLIAGRSVAKTMLARTGEIDTGFFAV